MSDPSRSFLFELLNTPSPSGFEAQGQRLWMNFVRQHVDEVDSDAYGSAWGTVRGTAGESGPSVMLEAHADEIGFMVRYVSDDGYLYISRIGGSDRAIARGRRVRVLGSQGPVPGVIGNTAIHIRDTSKDEKVPEWHELFVDIGATDKEEVSQRGIRVGNPLVYADQVEELTAGRLIGRALDNRIGGYIVAEALARLHSGSRPEATVYGVNAVQEELGGHGARMVAYRLHPAVALVLDVTHSTDSPGIDLKRHGDVRLGEGPSVSHGSANHPKVVARLIQLAKTEKIPLQHESTLYRTGTDTDDIFVARTGVPAALVSLPMRYMHSTVEMVDLEDVERCIRLLVAFARSIRSDEDWRVAGL